MRLTRLTMKNFAPFADGEIDFPEVEAGEGLAEVHMLTGENGTGKTRVLTALIAALGNIGPLQDRVRQDSGTELEVDAYFGESAEWEFSRGNWIFNNSAESREYPYISSSGHAMAGSGVAILEDLLVDNGTEIKPGKIHEFLSFNTASNSALRLTDFRKQVAFERDASGVKSPGRLTKCLTRLESAITSITKEEFSLLLQPGRSTRLVAKWGKAELYFSEIPDGLRSLLSWLAGWVVFQAEKFGESADPLSEPVTLILDEPENHLHPQWQRRVLPAIQRLFPNAQIFVVTHSPFVVSSLNLGWIHKFTRGDDGLVQIEQAQKASRGDSYMTAVQEILDLDEWFDPETEEEIAQFETLLDEAYDGDSGHIEKMRKKATEVKERSEEVLNLITNLEAQFNRTMEARQKTSPKTPVAEA